MQPFLTAALTTMPIAIINAFSPLMAKAVVFTARPFPIVVLVIAGLFLLFRKLPNTNALSALSHISHKALDVGVVIFSVCVTLLAAVGLKNYYKIVRPSVFDLNLHALIQQSDFGFPSGHAAVFASLAVALFFTSRKAGILASVAALIIAAARVLSGVHTPLDILGGFLLGISVSLITGFIIEHITSHSPKAIQA